MRSVIAASIRSGSRLCVPGSTSTKTGTAPSARATWAVATKLYGLVMTSSPGRTPAARSASWIATVPLQQATA